MDVDYAFLCDSAQESGGKVHALGIGIDGIFAPVLPATHSVVLVAQFRYWAAEAGSRIATATQHLHGGMGVDLDYPIHRYFLWSKALELEQGGATKQLVHLGRDLARSGPQEAL